MANLLDSSVWIALFLDFDTHHQKATSLFSKLRGKIYLPYCVANEVITVLTYKHSKEQANQFIQYLENNRDIKFVDDNIRDEIVFYQTIKDRVSLTDATLVLLTTTLPAKLTTFDKQLERLAKKFQ